MRRQFMVAGRSAYSRTTRNAVCSRYAPCVLMVGLLLLTALGLPVAESSAILEAANEQPKAAARLLRPARISLAFLGIGNASNDPSQAFWGDGLVLELEERLRQAESVRLVPTHSFAWKIDAAQARKIGAEAEARRVIWGSYERQPLGWLLTLHVENVATGKGSEVSATGATWPEVLNSLAVRVMQEVGVIPTAEELQKILSCSTGSPVAIEWLCKARSSYSMESEPVIENWVRRALDADPRCAEAHLLLARTLATQGDLAGAEKETRTALALRPNLIQAHGVLGVVLYREKRATAAKEELQTALRGDPNDVENLIRLGELYEGSGEAKRAADYYARATRADPRGGWAYAHLGCNEAWQGNREKALRELKTAEQLGGEWDIHTEEYLCRGYEALHAFPQAVYHCRAALALLEHSGVSPEYIRFFRDNLTNMQSRFSPHFIEVPQVKDYSPAELQQSLTARLSPGEYGRTVNPLVSNPQMAQWASHATASATNDLERARMLFDALLQHVDVGFGIKLRTAEQAFDAWKQKGTSLICQEYAFLYVALARTLGIKAYVAEVTEAFNGNQTLHACAAVIVKDSALLVDPSDYWFGVPHKKYHVLNDLETIASYLAQRKRGASPQGLRDIQTAAKLDPHSGIAKLNLIAALMNTGRWKDAQKDLRALEQSGSYPAIADYFEAMLALHQDRQDTAVALLEKSVSIEPDLANAHLALGTTYEKTGRLREARKSFRTALRYPMDEASEEQAREGLAQINEKLGAEQ